VPPDDGEVRRLLGEQAVPGGEGGELQAAVCPEFSSTFRTYVRTVSTVMFRSRERRPQELSGRIPLAFFSAKMARRSGDWLSAVSPSWEPQL
jgi:hypothetical protein